MPQLIDPEQSSVLYRMATLEEVKKAIFNLNGDSASGPDGFSGIFYQACWDIVGTHVFKMVIAFFEGHTLPKSITHTNMILLPKKEMVNTYSDLSPIRMSNFINKVMSRIIHDRFEDVLPQLISINHSGFVKGRSFFHSTRGVKQCDPLSPALFILTAEVLSRALNALYDDSSYVGYGVPKWSHNLNHLSYADDTIIFASTHKESLGKIMKILQGYETTSGQLINKDKIAFYMYQKVADNFVQQVAQITGFSRDQFSLKYLGCQIFHARRKKVYYNELIKKVKNKLQNWKERLLSYGGKAVNKEEGKSRHWVAWDNVCLPKEEGGLGFRSLYDVSNALFAKLWWRFKTTNSLWSTFMWNKYCKRLRPTEVQWKGGSQVWKKMLEARDQTEQHIWWEPMNEEFNVL
ncbi:uncharacterized protein LOC132041955 [Lycium ferocissimum]|uniref:uncharacterized protein LOC132041955 n=1 Tax=Lycium ferocissimum TaxID=112874 RepID=UPI002815D7F9|nr:uncharacterized protein LOC132041955 [Lycium ferocissimum]